MGRVGGGGIYQHSVDTSTVTTTALTLELIAVYLLASERDCFDADAKYEPLNCLADVCDTTPTFRY